MPSRFLDELPEAHVVVKEPAGGTGGFGMSGYGASRFDETNSFGSGYTTPGWRRAQERKGAGGFSENGQPRYVPDGVFNQDGSNDTDGPASAEGSGGFRTPRAPHGRRNAKREGVLIEGELVAKSSASASHFAVGERVFHQKFGNGNVTAVDGNKLTIKFDHAGEKRVVDSFVERV
jgi:DNA helicase-2/ATP-dependent DNA helicase PcrA